MGLSGVQLLAKLELAQLDERTNKIKETCIYLSKGTVAVSAVQLALAPIIYVLYDAGLILDPFVAVHRYAVLGFAALQIIASFFGFWGGSNFSRDALGVFNAFLLLEFVTFLGGGMYSLLVLSQSGSVIVFAALIVAWFFCDYYAVRFNKMLKLLANTQFYEG